MTNHPSLHHGAMPHLIALSPDGKRILAEWEEPDGEVSSEDEFYDRAETEPAGGELAGVGRTQRRAIKAASLAAIKLIEAVTS